MELPNDMKSILEQLASNMLNLSKENGKEKYGDLLKQLYDIVKKFSLARDEGQKISVREQITALSQATVLDLTQ